MIRVALTLGLVIPLSGCTATVTIGELGFPAFESVVGAGTRYETMPSPQGLDARPVEGEVGERHLAHFWPVPAGDEDTVFVAVGVEPGAQTVPLSKLAVTAHPLERSAIQGFSREGRLPTASILVAQAESTADEDGALRLLLRLPRDQLPPDCEHLALPILVVYEDGWVQLRFFRAVVPDPYQLGEEEVQEAPPETLPTGSAGDPR